ncbi:MAG: hypothetical protein ACI8QC_001221 [Planctomycetota bacterium]|jgi:hypothetical protein
MSAGGEAQAAGPRGLCPGCSHVHIVKSPRGSLFLRCTRSKEDARFAKYPPQPVRRCEGYEAAPGGTR